MAWFLFQRIRAAIEPRLEAAFGVRTEANGSCVSGKEENGHAHKRQDAGCDAVGNAALVGLRNRGTGGVRPETAKDTLQLTSGSSSPSRIRLSVIMRAIVELGARQEPVNQHNRLHLGLLTRLLENSGALRARMALVVATALFSIASPLRSSAQEHDYEWLSPDSTHIDPTRWLNSLPDRQAALADYHRRKELGLLPISAGKTSEKIGDQRTFKLQDWVNGGHRTAEFRLVAIRDGFLVWLETYFLDMGRQARSELFTFIQAFDSKTPKHSINPSKGILSNDISVFGQPPDVDGNGKIDVLIANESAVAGWADVLDLSHRGNLRDILYITSNYAPSMSLLAAHELVHLIEFNYDLDEISFNVEGAAELGKQINGYGIVNPSYLSDPARYNANLTNWTELSVWDRYTRAALFTHYWSERIGIYDAGAIVRDNANGLTAYENALGKHNLEFSDVLLDFHVTNMLNNKDVASKYGYSGVYHANVRATPIHEVKDGRLAGRTTYEKSWTLNPGAPAYFDWHHVSEFWLSVNPKSATSTALKTVVVLERDGTYTTKTLTVGKSPTLFSGAYDRITVITAHLDARSQAPRESFDLSASWTVPQAPGTLEKDWQALKALYSATGGANWTDNTNWSASASENLPSAAELNTWHGVSVVNGRVRSLDLSMNNLEGKLPSELGNLGALQQLNVSGNALTGRVPVSLSRLAELKTLMFQASGSTSQTVCAPPDDAFQAWLEGIHNRSGPDCPAGTLDKDRSALIALYKSTGGANWISNTNWSTSTAAMPTADEVNAWHGVTVSDGRVTKVELSANNLTGTLPTELGKLTALETLSLHENSLTGQLPTSLANLQVLGNFQFQAATSTSQTLCAPLDETFQTWLDEVHLVNGPDCADGSLEGDWRALIALYAATGGAAWTSSTNWSTSTTATPTADVLDSWHGVTVTDGRVTGLDLGSNNLSGKLPTVLGELAALRVLRLEDNSLMGPLPMSFARLTSLEEFSFQAGTSMNQTVCAPTDASFQVWLSGIGSKNGPNCSPGTVVSEQDWRALLSLFEATGGSAWTNNTNWSTSTAAIPSTSELDAWQGVTVADGRVTSLDLGGNNLTGRLPTALGDLDSLKTLRLDGNNLTGLLPLDLVNLTKLSRLEFQASFSAGQTLCAPLDATFRAWLDAVGTTNGPDCPLGTLNERDWRALIALYNATDGDSWTKSTNWSTATAIVPKAAELGAWHGVTVANGRVTKLELNDNGLRGTLPAELGNLTGLTSLDLGKAYTSGPIPKELGKLTQLESLKIYRSSVEGPVPSEFGNLTRLTTLWISRNQLTGTLPSSLTNLASLDNFYFDYQALCAPLGAGIQTWLAGIATSEGPDCPAGTLENDWRALIALNNATGGASWMKDTNWSTSTNSAPTAEELDAWYGVTVTDGRVRGLDLSANNLTGTLPANLGELAALESLALNSNTLTGTLPESLTNLKVLATLHFQADMTDQTVCAVTSAKFQEWLQGVDDLNGPNCPAGSLESDWRALVALYNAAGGASWTTSTNWSTSTTSIPTATELNDWHGVTVIDGRVRGLDLGGNNLTGGIPIQVGDLSALRSLSLHNNRLTGKLPLSLTSLEELDSFQFHAGSGNTDQTICAPVNALFQRWLGSVGSVNGPKCAEGVNKSDWRALVELYSASNGGSWTNSSNWSTSSVVPTEEELKTWHGVSVTGGRVTGLDLRNNNLRGQIPAALGNLTALTKLSLSGNKLRGPIPAALGNLTALTRLSLNNNKLTGSIPAQLQELSQLVTLNLSRNSLSGKVPWALSSLTSLTSLGLRGNALTGQIPVSFTDLTALESFAFQAGSDGKQSLCAPREPAFRTWLDAITTVSGPDCAQGTLNQNDWLALIALYNHTNGNSWTTNTNWSTSTASVPTAKELGKWYGVTVTDGRVTGLALAGIRMGGRLPAELGNLTGLTSLEIDYALTGGPIPAELRKLTNLESLRITTTYVRGPVPSWLGNLTRLTTLWLSDNELVGELPLSLVNLTSLTDFRFRNNLGSEILCAPLDASFQSWLNGITTVVGPNCTSAPGLVENLAVIAVSGPGLSATWDAPAGNGGSPVTGYSVQYRLTDTDDGQAGNQPGSWQDVTHTGTGTTATIPGLTANTGYDVQVAAVNAVETGGYAEASTSTFALLESDWHVLIALYEATGGASWTTSTNWSTSRAIVPNAAQLDTWHGVSVTGGRVTGLDLSSNGLAGTLPAELGNLTGLTTLWLHGNSLTGKLPASVTNLTSLTSFRFRGSQTLCAPLDARIQVWLNGITTVDGPDCAPAAPGPVQNLAVSAATAFTLSASWDSPAYAGDRPVTGYSVQYRLTDTNDQQAGNQPGIWQDVAHTGTAASIAGLTGGTEYEVQVAAVSAGGTGDYAKASASTMALLENDWRALIAFYNATVGSYWTKSTNWSTSTAGVPTAAQLNTWHGVTVSNGRVTGLVLRNNGLAGTLPSELGNLTGLTSLEIYLASLSGPIPSELGNLTNLESLKIYDTIVSGPVPTGLGILTGLTTLWLHDNSLTGKLPTSLTNLTKLTDFKFQDQYGNQTLCAPLDTGFQSWLNGITTKIGSNCAVAAPWLVQNLTVTAASTSSLSVAWDEPTDTGSSSVTGYSVQYRLADTDDGQAGNQPGSWQDVTHTGTGTTATITGLMVGTRYDVQVAAINAAGTGVFTEATQTTATVDVPGQAQNLAVIAASGQGVSATWDAPADNGGSPVTGYSVQYRLTDTDDGQAGNQPGSWQDVTHTGTGTTATITGLAANTGYDVQVAAVNAVGTGGYAKASASTFALLESDWRALIGLYEATGGASWTTSTNWSTSTAIVPNAAQLDTWHGVTVSGGRVTGLDLSSNGLAGTLPAELGILTGLTTLWLHGNSLTGELPASLTNLTSLTSFQFRGSQTLCAPLDARIQAWLNGITTVDGPDCAPAAPGRVQNLAVSVVSAFTLSVSWDSPADAGDLPVTGYSVQYRQSDTDGNTQGNQPGAWQDATHAGTGTTASITGLTGGTGYDVQVAAVNAGGTGESVQASTFTMALLENDWRALVALYNATVGSDWTTSTNWSTFTAIVPNAAQLDTWHGVTVSNGRVTRLELGDNHLWGTLPAALGNLTGLISLNLGNAYTSGTLPVELASLTQLESLKIHDTYVSGPVPTGLGNLTRLTTLWLHGSSLSGKLPSSLTALTSLTNFRFSDSQGAQTLCAPQVESFQAWLAGIAIVDGPDCLTPGAPGEVENLAVSAVSTSSLSVAWDEPAESGSSSVAGYSVQYRETDTDETTQGNQPGAWQDIAHTGTSASVTGLAANTGYDVRVAAINAVGTGGYAEASASTFALLESDWRALIALYEATGGTRWTTSTNWSISRAIVPNAAQLDTWHGVTVTGGRVTGLKLGGNGLAGTLPAELGNLSGLTTLWISGNRLTGKLPPSLTNLTSLTSFQFQGSQALCAPLDTDFQAWLEGIASAEGPDCISSVPGMVSGLSLSATSGSVLSATWTAPEDNGGSPVTGYSVQYRLTDTDGNTQGNQPGAWQDATHTGTDAAATIAGLNASTSYDVQVAAVNAAGTGSYATHATQTTSGAGAPGLVTGLSLSATSGSVLAATWTAPEDNGGSPVTGYSVQYRLTDTDGNAQGNQPGAWQDASHSGTAAAATIAGLNASTSYDVQVAAVNAAGTGSYATHATQTTSGAGAPGLVTGLSLSATSGSVLAATWTAPEDNGGSPVTGYSVQYRLTDTDGNTQGNQPGAWQDASHTGTDAAATIAGLNASTSYDVQVAAVNAAGTGSYATHATQTTSGASAPGLVTGLSLSATSGSVLAATWTAPEDNGGSPVTGYSVQYRLTDTDGNTQGNQPGAWQDASHTGTDAAATISGLNASTSYDVQVAAVNAAGTGSYATHATQTTSGAGAPGLVTGLSLSATSGSVLAATWTAPEDNGGSPVTGYSVQYRLTDTDGNTQGNQPGAWQDASHTGTDAAATISGLNASTSYDVQVAAVNAAGTGSYATHATQTTSGAGAPGLVTGLSLSATSGSVLAATWTAPEDNGGSPVTGYSVQYRLTDTNPNTQGNQPGAWQDASHTGTDAAATIAGLNASTSYDVQVAAVNAAGTGSYATHATQTTSGAGAPGLVTGLSLSATSGSVLAATWTAPEDNGGSPVTGYSVQYRLTDTDGNAQGNQPGAWQDASHSGTAAAATIAGLNASTSYDVQVAAVNAAGTGSYATHATQTTSGAGAPGLVTGLSLSATSGSVLAATWTAPEDNGGSPVTGYSVQYRLTDTDGNTQGNQPGAWQDASHTGTDAAATIAGLNASTSYDVQVAAVNAAGTGSYATHATQTTSGAGAPGLVTGLALSATSGSVLAATWTAPEDNGGSPVTGYSVQYRLTDTNPNTQGNQPGAWQDATHTGTDAAATIAGLNASTSYDVQVAAVNAAGTGSYATHATQTTSGAGAPGLVTGLSLSATSGSVLAATWTAPEDNGGSPVTGYSVQYRLTDTNPNTQGNQPGAWQDASHTGTDAAATIAGLNASTSYDVQVAAVNAAGTGSYATHATQTTSGAGAPGLVTGLALSATSGSVLAATWTAPEDNGGSPVTGYSVQYRLTDTNPNTQGNQPGAWQDASHTGTDAAATIAGLNASTSYDVQVAAVNAAGTGSYATHATQTTSGAGAPGLVTGLSLSATSGSVLAATWTAPEDNGGSPVTGYSVQYRLTDTDGNTQGNQPGAWQDASHSGTDAAATISGLNASTSYDVQVAAVNAAGTGSYATHATQTTSGAGAPGLVTGLSLSATSGSVLAATWTAPEDNGGSPVTGYSVQYRLTDTERQHAGQPARRLAGRLPYRHRRRRHHCRAQRQHQLRRAGRRRQRRRHRQLCHARHPDHQWRRRARPRHGPQP